MATFKASLGNATIGTGCATISITDDSNYDTTLLYSGYLRNKFTIYRKVVIEYTDGTKYTLSSMGDGDAPIDAADTSNDTFTFPVTKGDGVYKVTLYTIPTWFTAALGPTGPFYLAGDMVIHGGKFYESLQDGNGGNDPSLPASTWWKEITEITDFSLKHYAIERIAVICELNCCIEDTLHKAFCVVDSVDCCEENLCENDTFMTSTKLLIIKKAIEASASNNAWTETVKQFQLASVLCKCC
jgi:hypothetical protein